MLRPLGSRVIIKPAPSETESAGGIVFPETAGAAPAMSGTVVATGTGTHAARRSRRRAIADCRALVAAHVHTPTLLAAIDGLSDRACDVSEGDIVCFAYTAGVNLTVADDAYILIDEADIQAVLVPEEHDV